MTRAEYRKHAEPIRVRVGELELTLDPKENSTGSLGWGHWGKMHVTVGGESIACQLNINLTMIDSKKLPPDPPAGGAT